MGGGGVKNDPKKSDIIYGRPLSTQSNFKVKNNLDLDYQIRFKY